MSYDVWLEIDTGHGEWQEVVEIGNYTMNVFPMWADALNGMSLREYHHALCSEAAGPLADGVKRMEADPEKYRAMNPSNGWGDYEGALNYLRAVAEACAAHPKCRIVVDA
ncbi:hypothetical protein [Acrocarpospora sp. B8E8]|uniref:hypothetical protein n=1 Tax=Acrocarpospora sp. B8E8 TaxID=3153572 RepID=UPI00325F4B8B